MNNSNIYLGIDIQDRDISPSSSSSLETPYNDEYPSYLHYVQSNNDKKVLLAMVIGLCDENDCFFTDNKHNDRFPTKQRKFDQS